MTDTRHDDESPDAVDLTEFVRRLHSRVSLTIEFDSPSRDRTTWKATARGEDFLDGDWERVETGVAPTAYEALLGVRDVMFARRRKTFGERLNGLFRRRSRK